MSLDKKIIDLYKEIMESQKSIVKKIGLNEADISGIDELVYNPATKQGGTIGYGYDNGKKVTGITWANHDNHLHIGFTNRDVAIAVIDKADQMGLTTTENPYAKKDPNGKVDQVHTSGSFHYKVFPGEPKVGAGVDISGDAAKVTEFIKWVETQYAGANFPSQETVDYAASGTTVSNSNVATNNTTTKTPSNYAQVVGTVTSAENMNEEIKDILNIYESILSNNALKEASSASDELLGGADFSIPDDGAHAGQKDWQSGNAWDIKGGVGDPVYALADGVAQTFSDYGKDVRATKGKKLYGQSFTVKSDGGLPSIYYTHLEGSPVRQGSTIKCGQFLGYIMDFPNSSYDHVHIGVESGNIRQFLNPDGTIKCAKGQKISGEELSDSPSSDDEVSDASSKAYDFAASKQLSKNLPKTKYAQVVGNVTSAEGLTEQRNFGKNVSNRYGRVVIPKEDNPKIKAPISGVINNRKYFSSCQNQITIENNDNETVYLQFCGITNAKVSNGKRVNIGDVLGTTDSDVEVIMYDKRWNRINIPSQDLKINKKDKSKETDDELDNAKKGSEPEYYDPLTAALFGLPGKLFKDKFDKSGNRVEKRYGGVADKKQVDPWVLNFLEDPFNRKKVNENIEKIKKLL